MQTLVDSLTKFISEHTEFSQDVFVAILGVVIGSILTALINTRATRTQAKFNMEHELLKEYHKKVHLLLLIAEGEEELGDKTVRSQLMQFVGT